MGRTRPLPGRPFCWPDAGPPLRRPADNRLAGSAAGRVNESCRAWPKRSNVKSSGELRARATRRFLGRAVTGPLGRRPPVAKTSGRRRPPRRRGPWMLFTIAFFGQRGAIFLTRGRGSGRRLARGVGRGVPPDAMPAHRCRRVCASAARQRPRTEIGARALEGGWWHHGVRPTPARGGRALRYASAWPAGISVLAP